MKSFEEVLERFRTIVIDEQFDLIVAIANGGLVPAGILAQKLSADSCNDCAGTGACAEGRNTGGADASGDVAGTRRGRSAGGVEVRLLRINLRDENQRPRYDSPRLLSPVDFEFAGKRILLVDDRIKSGSTIRLARELLKDAALVRTFAVNGDADYALYNEACFKFPWIL